MGTEALRTGKTMRFFKKVVDIIIKLMIPLVILTLVMGMARIVLDLRNVFGSATIAVGFDIMVTNILSMFIVVELLRSIIEYFEIQRLKITFIIDAAIVFILREVMVGLYQHTMDAITVGALGAFLLVIGGVRTLAVLYSPDGRKEGTRHE